MYYTGIGSRITPLWVRKLMSAIAFELWADGFTLRSGHSPGADQAFEAGASELDLLMKLMN
jgi:hypothetical protein